MLLALSPLPWRQNPLRPFVHREICEPVGILVLLAPHVLERHAVERGGQRAGLLVQRLEAGVLDAVLALHLFDEEL